VRPLKNLTLEDFKLIATELRLSLLMLSDRLYDVLFDVFQESLDEGRADFGDAAA
jgi:hypothetical protein